MTILGGSTGEQGHLHVYLWHMEAAVFCTLFCSLPRILVLLSHAEWWDMGIYFLFGAIPAELAEIGAKVVVEAFSLSLRNLPSYHGFVV